MPQEIFAAGIPYVTKCRGGKNHVANYIGGMTSSIRRLAHCGDRKCIPSAGPVRTFTPNTLFISLPRGGLVWAYPLVSRDP